MNEPNPYSSPPTVDVDPDETNNAKHDRPSFFTVYGGAVLGGIVGSLGCGWLFGVEEHPNAPSIGLPVGVAIALLFVAIFRRTRQRF